MDSRFTTNEQVLNAVLDRANGNRPLTSKALLQCRISEVWNERYKAQREFEEFMRKYFRPGDMN